MKKDFQLNQSKENPSRWKPGEKVQHFTILNYIASEPLGDNYLAKDSQLNRIVAIKRFSFNVDMKYSAELVKKLQKKFLDDVKLFSRWDHPNLVSIHYFDVDEYGTPFYAMEYVPKTLGHWIGLVNDETEEAFETKSTSFSHEESIEIILGICKGLNVMHQEGICHYRISPNNILMTPEGIPKLVSFGIEAGMRTELASKIQRKYRGIYSAPEQIRGDQRSIGNKSDIYTIGLLFFQLLTGKLPRGILQKDNFKSLGINKPAQNILISILKENPNDRPADLSEIIQKLRQLKRGISSSKTGERKYVFPIVVSAIFLCVFFGILSIKDSSEGQITVTSNFTPMIPASIYENFDPLEQYIFWTEIGNTSSQDVEMELSAKFKGISDEWDKLIFIVPAQTDTVIGINPFMNIFDEKQDLRSNRNYYIDWKLIKKSSSSLEQQSSNRLISEGSERIVMLGLGTIDWEILKDVFSNSNEKFSPYSLISSWIIPKDTRGVISKTNLLFNSSIVGYQQSIFESYSGIVGNTKREIVQYQLEKIYNVLKNEYQIVYDGGGIGQTINFPSETIKFNSANCIELAVLFSSVLLEAGIEPVIVIIPDHAFIGWQIWKNLHEYDFLETTFIGDKEKSFSDAIQSGNKLAADYGLNEMIVGGFDVSQFDSRGIYKKSSRVEVLHISSLRNFKDNQGRQVYTSVPIGYEID